MRRMLTGAIVAAVWITQTFSCAHQPTPPHRLTGRWHTVQGNDTIESVARQYGANPVEIAELNDLNGDTALRSRSEIFIPKKGGRLPGTGAPPPPPFRPELPTPKPTTQPAADTSDMALGRCDQQQRSCLIWPVLGKLSSRFGPRGKSHHDGLDIAAAKGTPVVAAADGQVLYSGAEIKGYGNLVVIKHNGGMVTVYAHNDENQVTEGQQVKQGDVIARVGNTGSSTTYHLHFEVRVDEKPTDPLPYLPPKENP